MAKVPLRQFASLRLWLFASLAATACALGACRREAPSAPLAPQVLRRATHFPKTETVHLEYEYYRAADGEEVLHGSYVENYANRGVRTRGQFDGGRQIGAWTAWHDNGKLWVRGKFDQGQPQGPWQYYDAEGESVGVRVDGVKTGAWREYNAQRDSVGEGAYRDGKMHGLWRFRDLAGTPLCDINFEMGRVEGAAKVYALLPVGFVIAHGREAPPLRTVEREDREYVGSDLEFGAAVREFTAPDFQNPLWLAEEAPFDPPTVYVQKLFGRDGKLQTEIEFRVGVLGGQPLRVRHGATKQWHADGTLRSCNRFVNGVEHGPSAAWHPSGQPRYTIEFKHGKATGTWQFFAESGQCLAQGVADGRTRRAWRFWDEAGREIAVDDATQWVKDRLRE